MFNEPSLDASFFHFDEPLNGLGMAFEALAPFLNNVTREVRTLGTGLQFPFIEATLKNLAVR